MKNNQHYFLRGYIYFMKVLLFIYYDHEFYFIFCSFSQRTENNYEHDSINCIFHKYVVILDRHVIMHFIFYLLIFFYLYFFIVQFIMCNQLVRMTYFDFQVKIKYFDHSVKLN